LDAVLTVLIFSESERANYLAQAILAASAIVGWIAIGCLYPFGKMDTVGEFQAL
jgi:hypothetical protein